MPPEETPNRPEPGRPPMPRRQSVDGFNRARYDQPLRRPDFTARAQPADTSSMPVEAPSAPPQQPALEPNETSPPATQSPVADTPADADTGTRDFTPQPKPRRRWPRVVLLILLIAIVAGVGYVWLHSQAERNKPDRVLRDALSQSLTTNYVSLQAGSGKTNLDLSSLTNPTVSSQAKLALDGSDFQLSAYGSAKNSYISYRQLPNSVPATLATATKNAWIQLRVSGQLPPGIPSSLNNLADPRYQAFGPVVFGNFPVKIRQQLLDYLIKQKVYKYDAAKVSHQTLDGTKVIVFPVKFNVGYLKIANQSAATSEGLTPADLQAATDALNALKNGSGTLYIRAHDHRIVRLDSLAGNQRTTVTYSYPTTSPVSAEPQTKLEWQQFAPFQWQLEAQAASHASAGTLDNQRQANLYKLHGLLAAYFVQNNAYPTFAQLSNQAWSDANLPGSDVELLRDPLASNLTLASAPKAGAIAYQPAAANGKACDTAGNPCTSYKLMSTLSNKQLFTVHDP